MNYYDLPENVHYQINKIIFSDVIVPHFNYKDWWWHTVECRANIKQCKLEKPGFLDPEIHGGQEHFSYGVGKFQ